VASPAFIAEDPVALEDRREELVDAAVAAVGKDLTVLATQRLDRAADRERRSGHLRMRLARSGS